MNALQINCKLFIFKVFILEILLKNTMNMEEEVVIISLNYYFFITY